MQNRFSRTEVEKQNRPLIFPKYVLWKWVVKANFFKHIDESKCLKASSTFVWNHSRFRKALFSEQIELNKLVNTILLILFVRIDVSQRSRQNKCPGYVWGKCVCVWVLTNIATQTPHTPTVRRNNWLARWSTKSKLLLRWESLLSTHPTRRNAMRCPVCMVLGPFLVTLIQSASVAQRKSVSIATGMLAKLTEWESAQVWVWVWVWVWV